MSESITSELADAIRMMPDYVLAKVARNLEDRSLVTLVVTMQQAEVEAYRAFGSAVPGGSPPELPQPKNRTRSKSPKDHAQCKPSGVTARVETLIRARPGLGSREIVRSLPDDTRTGIRNALRRLSAQRRIRREGSTSDSRYFPRLTAVSAS